MRIGTLLGVGALVLGGATGVARADVPPPPGTKRVPFVLEIDNLAAHADFTLFVFPWSASNGAPTTEIGAVSAAGLSFGRRISGQPKLYAAPRARFEEVLQQLGGRDDLDPQAVPIEGAIDCGRSIDPVHTVADGGPDTVTMRLTLTRLDATTCTTDELPSPSLQAARQPRTGGCASCSVGGEVRGGAHGTAVGALALGLTLARRRRRAR